MKKSPFYPYWEKKNAEFATGLWAAPLKFTDSVEEELAVRRAIGVTDFSGMGKFNVCGPDAKAYIQKLIVNDMNKLEPGKVLYSCMTNEEGGIIDDFTIYCFTEEHYWVLSSTGLRMKSKEWMLSHVGDFKVYVTDITSNYGLLAVQGPKSRDCLNCICDSKVDDLKYFRYKWVKIAGVDVLVSRTGFTGELGYELFMMSEDSSDVWEALENAGKDFGLKNIGITAAVFVLRTEKGYLAWDYSEQTNPYEMGLDWTVCLDTNFIGSDALRKIKETGVKNTLIGYELSDKTIVPANKSEVYVGDVPVGIVSSACFSTTLDKSIGMLYIDSNYAKLGSTVQIKVPEGLKDAVLVNKIHYDHKGALLHS